MSLSASTAAPPLAKVAIGLYGLLRHACTIDAFLWSVGSLSAPHDLFISAAHERLPFTPRSSEYGQVPVQLGAFVRLLETSTFAVESQLSIDLKVKDLFRQAMKYGDVYTFSVNGSSTLNTVRALYLMRRLADLIEAQETRRGSAYEYAVMTRVDVLFTRRLPPLPLWPKAGVATSDYAAYGYDFLKRGGRMAGTNDRFMLGERASVLRLMRRSDLLPRWYKQMDRVYIPEVFLRWASAQLGIRVEPMYAGYNRRVRASGALVKAQYSKFRARARTPPKGLWNCTLDTMATCVLGPAELRACEEEAAAARPVVMESQKQAKAMKANGRPRYARIRRSDKLSSQRPRSG